MFSFYINTETDAHAHSLFTNDNIEFQSIPGVPKMKENTNPTTWLLSTTFKSPEDVLIRHKFTRTRLSL